MTGLEVGINGCGLYYMKLLFLEHPPTELEVRNIMEAIPERCRD